MNIHEHQAKDILRDYGAPVARGVVNAVFTPASSRDGALPSATLGRGAGRPLGPRPP